MAALREANRVGRRAGGGGNGLRSMTVGPGPWPGRERAWGSMAADAHMSTSVMS